MGSLGASTAVSIVSFLAIWSAAHGHGPFSGGPAEQDALSIQIFLIVLAIPLLFLATVIEERVTGATELGESESRFRNVADAAPVLIWMAGVDKLCTFFNKPWLEFTGRSIEQELGNGWAEGVHPDDLQKCLEIYTEAFDARQPFVMQYRLRRNDGEYRWLSDQGVARHDAQGGFAGYIGSCVDITELMKKEEALHEFEERVVLAAEAAHLGVWEMDPATKELWMSDSARTLFQFDSETPLDHAAFQDRVHPEDRALRDSAVKHALETGGGYEMEYRVLLPDGTQRWIGARARCVAGDNRKGARLIGVSIDITPRKLAEAEALRQRDELSHLSRVALMGEMSASIAHELNQPLAGFSVTPQLDSVSSIAGMLIRGKFANCSVTSSQMVAAPVTYSRHSGDGKERAGGASLGEYQRGCDGRSAHDISRCPAAFVPVWKHRSMRVCGPSKPTRFNFNRSC